MVDISGLTINLEIKEVNFFVTGSSKIILSAGAGNGDIPSLKFVFFDDTGKTYIEIKSGAFAISVFREIFRYSGQTSYNRSNASFMEMDYSFFTDNDNSILDFAEIY